jgi:hypothetical protein
MKFWSDNLMDGMWIAFSTATGVMACQATKELNSVKYSATIFQPGLAGVNLPAQVMTKRPKWKEHRDVL